MTFGFEAASGQRRSASARAMCPGRAGTNGRATGTRRGRSGVGKLFVWLPGRSGWKDGKARWRGGDAAGFGGHGGNGSAPQRAFPARALPSILLAPKGHEHDPLGRLHGAPRAAASTVGIPLVHQLLASELETRFQNWHRPNSLSARRALRRHDERGRRRVRRGGGRFRLRSRRFR